MPESSILRFADAAERQVVPPPLDDLVRRGRRRHARHGATAVVAAVALLALTGWLLGPGRTPDSAPPAGGPSSDHGTATDVRQLPLGGEAAQLEIDRTHLTAGQDYFVRPFGSADAVRVWFRQPSPRWNWWGNGGHFVEPGAGHPYATFAILDLAAVSAQPCEPYWVSWWRAAAPTATAAAEQVSTIPGVRVEQRPEPGTAFGQPVVHLSISVPRACHSGPGFFLFHNSRGFYVYARQPTRMELWLTDTPAGVLLVAAYYRPGVGPEALSQLEDVVNSIRVDHELP